MSASVGTPRAGSNRHTKSTVKASKGDSGTSSQQQTANKNEGAPVKMQPTQEQLRLAQMMNAGQADTDPKQIKLIKELAELTGKKEDVVVIALHDTGNDADRAVMLLLEGGEEQGEWREQGGKRKKKNQPSQKDATNHVSDEQYEGRNKEREDRDGDRDKDGGFDRQDAPPRRGRRNGGPPPRLARGRGRDRGTGSDRDRNMNEDWDNEDKPQRNDKERSGGDRGRSRGRGGFGRKSGGGGSSGGGGGGGGSSSGGNRGRYNNSGERDNRGYNRVPRFDKMNNSQPVEGPEIDTWTNETAETNTSKDTDWDNWKDSWVNEEDQWTGTLEETKVFTPSQMKLPESDLAVPVADPPSSLGQRLDVDSLFIETAKYSKAPDYTKPGNDAYINQFNQAATESIKNSIGIGSSSRQTLGMTQPSSSNPLGLSNLGQSSASAQNSVLSSLPQDPNHSSSMQHTMSQLSQISQSVSQAQAMSQIGMATQQAQVNNGQTQQSRIPSMIQQQQQCLPAQANMNSSLQQRPKPQRSKLPPPSKIPSSAVEMPGHIPLNTQLDLQFGIDFGTDTSFGFGGGSGDSTAVTSSYSTVTNGNSSVISNHLNQGHVSQSSGDGGSVSNILPSSSTPSKVPSGMESQTSNRQGVFHNTVYTASQTTPEGQSLDRDQNKINDSISFPSSQLERKSSPLTSQRSGQSSQNLSSGSITSSKNDVSNNLASSSSSQNFYSVSSYQNHQKGSIAHSTNQQPQQNSTFPGQYSASQSAYSSTGQAQFPSTQNAAPFPSSGQAPQYNSSQNQYSSGQSQYSTGTSTLPHQTQYPAGAQNSYSGQYSGYQNSSSFPSHPPQSNFPSSQSGGPSAGLYPASTQPVASSYTSQSNSYQSPSAGSSYHSRDSQSNVPVSTQSSSGVSFPSQAQSSNLKPASTQSGSSYNSQSFNASPTPNKLGDSLSKMSIKDSVLENHQSSQFEHTSSSASSVPTSLSLPSATSTSLSSGTNTISSTSTATSVTSTSRIVSMPSTCKAPPNLPPGVPLMGQYVTGQSIMPPFYSVQPPLYGYEDVQLLQQRVPLQAGSYYDMSPFPAQAGSTLPTGRDQQTAISNVPFSGTSDTSKMPRVDAQSPNASSQPQNAHSAAQQPLFNFHYSYIYPSTMFPGAAGLQYPTMFPIPPVTNTAAHAGTTATTQFQKTYPSHVYSTKGYEELNQAQDFSKSGYGSSQNTGKASGTRSGTSEITPNAYNKSHTQGFDKQGYHGGTPPPFNLPLATATQAGPLGAPTTPYGAAPFLPMMAAHQPHSQMMHHTIQQGFDKQGYHGGTPPPFNLPLATATQAGPLGAPTTPYGAAPFLPMMAAHQPHSQMMHHTIQQDSNSSSSRGLNQTSSQTKTGAGKAYAGAPYWSS